MILKANVVEALRSLASSKQRSLLALIGIVIGIGSVIAMVSVGTIVKNETLKQFTSMGTDILTVVPDMSRSKKGQNSFSLAVALGIPEYCPSVLTVAPYMSSSMTLRYNRQKVDVMVLGATESASDLFRLSAAQGRLLSSLDNNMFFVVLSAELAGQLAGIGLVDPVGKEFILDNHICTVIGVMDRVARGAMQPFELSDGLIMPLSTVKRLQVNGRITNITARLAPGASPDGAKAELTGYFRTRQKGLEIRTRSAEAIIESLQKQMKLFTLLLGTIGSISLIVGGVGVMNVMLVSVSERRKEIGIRRALGALQSDIMAQFLIESLVLSAIGGLFGTLLGVGAAWGVSVFSKWEFFVTTTPVFLGVGVSASVGIFFGIYPARTAAKLKPIDALRAE